MTEETTERFVDQAEKPIPSQDTWDQLTINQLIDVKAQLDDKLWHFQKVPQIAMVLKRSISQIEKMISQGNS
jgi:hypothetical protein